MNSIYKDKRSEFNKPQFKQFLVDMLGCECVACGSKEYIEYHHIVPLINGGDNHIGNIVPLCQSCHYKAHDKTYKKLCTTSGRPKFRLAVDDDEAISIFTRWYNESIGTAEAKELLGIKSKSTWFKFKDGMLQRFNLENRYNGVDRIASESKRLSNR